jgi:hypothetical protein
VVGGQAIYFWARLPPAQQDDNAVVEWLVRNHGVCVVPGSSCGAPGAALPICIEAAIITACLPSMRQLWYCTLCNACGVVVH